MIPLKKLIPFSALLTAASLAGAFEVKGIRPGMPISSVDLKDCYREPAVYKGLPGYRCRSSLGDDKADLTIVAWDEKVAIASFHVKRLDAGPAALEALTAKYGSYNKQMGGWMWENFQSYLLMQITYSPDGFAVYVVHRALKEAVDGNAKKNY